MVCSLRASVQRLVSLTAERYIPGSSPGPKEKTIQVGTSESEDDDQHLVTSEEVADARAQAAVAAAKYGGSEHPEPLFMPGQVLPWHCVVCPSVSMRL